MKKIKGRVLNWRPDLPDSRDFLYKSEAPRELPDIVDLRSNMPPIVNQFQTSSCTGNALAGSIDHLQIMELKTSGLQPHEYDLSGFLPSARLMIYYNGRAETGMQNQDSGAYIRDDIKGLFKFGVCRENLWPFLVTNVLKKPSRDAFAEGVKHKISQYSRLNGLYQLKECLANGFPVTFGFSVVDSFYNVGADGMVPLPLQNERVLGGHAVVACGYNDKLQLFFVRNSWGTRWGQNGYCYFPYQYLTDSSLSSDFWTIRV